MGDPDTDFAHWQVGLVNFLHYQQNLAWFDSDFCASGDHSLNTFFLVKFTE